MSDLQVKYESQGCWVCGEGNRDGFKVKFFSESDDSVFFRAAVPAKYQGYDGVVHGGLISALLDEVMANCFFLKGIRCVTAEMNVRFLKPLPIEHEIRVVGKIVERMRKMGMAKGWIEDDSGVRYAEGEGAFYFVEIPPVCPDEELETRKTK